MSVEFSSAIELPVTVCADYQPREAQTRDYPGCDEAATLTSVMLTTDDGDVDILDQLSPETIDSLMQDAMQAARNSHCRRLGLLPTFHQIAQEEREKCLAESARQRGARI